jgi:hypothetical protein
MKIRSIIIILRKDYLYEMINDIRLDFDFDATLCPLKSDKITQALVSGKKNIPRY